MTGFGNSVGSESVYDSFIGKPGHYGSGPVTATGVLKEVNLKEGYFAVQPSLVGWGESNVRLETENPTVIVFGAGNPISIRPLREGDLEVMAEERRVANERKAQEKSC